MKHFLKVEYFWNQKTIDIRETSKLIMVTI